MSNWLVEDGDKIVKVIFVFLLISLAAISVQAASVQAADDFPRYKPSSRSPSPLDIRTNLYGASRYAPDAIKVGEKVPDFVVPRAPGGLFSLATAVESSDVVIIFYRGHW